MSKPIRLICKEYSEDIERYLNNKLPDLPPATAQEIAEYITCKTQNFTNDLHREYERLMYLRSKRSHGSWVKEEKE